MRLEAADSMRIVVATNKPEQTPSRSIQDPLQQMLPDDVSDQLYLGNLTLLINHLA